MSQSDDIPKPQQSIQVVVRFVLRMAVLVIFAAFGTNFAGSMMALLWMSAVLCAATAIVRRELPLRGDLNHWDEMTSYIALCCLATRFALPAPA